VSEKFLAYGKKVSARLKETGIRSELDSRNEKLGYKIRAAQMQKIPYMLVVGNQEQEAESVNVRRRQGDELGALNIAEFIQRAQAKIAQRGDDL
jgi:threonyl-tRNA synthetase